MAFVKRLARKFAPKSLINLYHGLRSYLAAFKYGFPSQKLIVIGVTGTNGKSTTVNLIAKALESSGEKVALTSTVNFKIDNKDVLNNLKMTMPGRDFLQKFLADAVSAGCKYAVIETSSEGLVQNRHWGIVYDVAVFTNLTPEHIESHGSFANYKKAKKILFNRLSHQRKVIAGQQVPTVIVANSDDEHAVFYLDAKADKKLTYGLRSSEIGTPEHLQATQIEVTPQGIKYKLLKEPVELKLKGRFDVYNSLAALTVAKALGLDLKNAAASLAEVELVPGRVEVLQEKPFWVVVDYAPEPESLKQIYETIKLWQIPGKIIHLLGSTGGGRDVARRPVLGRLAGEVAKIVIVTNEDPYNDDPQKIVDQVAEGAQGAGKVEGQDLFKILDRREAIHKALALAKEGDLVLLTGKGSEQKMAVRGGYIDWDDRAVAREELAKL